MEIFKGLIDHTLGAVGAIGASFIAIVVFVIYAGQKSKTVGELEEKPKERTDGE